MNVAASLWALSQYESNQKSIMDNKKKVQNNLKKIEEVLKGDRVSEEENQIQRQCEVEKVSASDSCQAEGDGSDNKQKVIEGSEPTSQKPKGRRVRKSN